MGFFTKLYEFLFGKGQTQEEDVYTKSVETPGQRPTKTIILKKPKYRKISRTRETNQFVEYMVKKANSPDPIAKPYKDATDIAMISKITNKLKEDLSRK